LFSLTLQLQSSKTVIGRKLEAAKDLAPVTDQMIELDPQIKNYLKMKPSA
jgi:hypothetical protein